MSSGFYPMKNFKVAVDSKILPFSDNLIISRNHTGIFFVRSSYNLWFSAI